MRESQLAGLIRHSAESNAFVKECLKTALLTLLADHSYNDLTVTMLCRKAGVSRMAFYRNYRAISDLFREAAVDLNDQVLESVGSPFRPGTTEAWYRGAFEIVKEHETEYSLMLSEEFQAEWMKVVNSLADHDPGFPAEKRYQRLAWCGGFENVLAAWLNRGMTESPEEMASYCIRYLPHLLAEDLA